MGDCGGEELLPGSVGGRGRSMRDGRLRTSFSFLDDRWGGVDFFGLAAQKKTKAHVMSCNQNFPTMGCFSNLSVNALKNSESVC